MAAWLGAPLLVALLLALPGQAQAERLEEESDAINGAALLQFGHQMGKLLQFGHQVDETGEAALATQGPRRGGVKWSGLQERARVSLQCKPWVDRAAFVFLGLFGLAVWYGRRYLEARAAEAGDPAIRGGRSAFIDNAKYMLMVFVVIEHVLLGPWWEGMDWTWHPEGVAGVAVEISGGMVMMFAFLSGMVSPRVCSWKALNQIFVRLVAPFVFYCLLIRPLCELLLMGPALFTDSLSLRTVAQSAIENLYLENGGVQWYLQALIQWRLLGLILPGSAPWRLLVAVAASAGSVYVRVPYFHMHRMATLLPVFVLGQLTPSTLMSGLQPLQLNFVSGLRIACFVCIQGLFFLNWQPWREFLDALPGFDAGNSARDYFNSCGSRLFGIRNLARPAVFVANAIVMLLAFCPRQACWMTTPGKHSIYAYLLHTFVITFALNVITSRPVLRDTVSASEHFPWVGPAIVLFSFILASVLTTWPFRKFFGAFLEPVWLQEVQQTCCPGDVPPDWMPPKQTPKRGDCAAERCLMTAGRPSS